MKISTAKGLVIASMIATAVHAAEYYVAADGSDSNSGTSPSQAWKSLSKVEGQMAQFTADANSEDVIIYFNNGDTWLNDELKITCIGSAGHWITFDGTAWGDNASGTSKATIRRTTSGTKNLIQIVYGNGSYDQDAYVVVQGFELDGNNLVDNTILEGLNASCVKILNNKIHDPLIGQWMPTVHFTTSANVAGTIEIHDLEVSNNEIYGAGAHGVAFYPRTGSGLDNVGNITARNNVIYNFGNSSSSAYGAGFQVVSCVGGIISGNTIYDSHDNSDGFGIKLEDRNRACSDIDVTGNNIYGGSGIELCVGISNDGGQNINVVNNVIRNTGSNGIAWGSPDSASGNIYNNTISGTGSTPIAISSSSSVGIYENNVNGATAAEDDTESPTVPASLSATAASSSSVNLSWSASGDNIGVSGYRIFRDGQEVATSFSASYSDSGLAESTLYTYQVCACDAAGNDSALSSSVSATTLSASDLISTSGWQNSSFEAQSDSFVAEFDAVPSSENINAVTGLASGDAAAFDSLAAIVRFNDSGQIDVRNGAVYTFDTAVSYSAGTEYHFRLSVNLAAHTYSVYVQAGGGSEILIADNYAFRTSQSAVAELDTLTVTAVSGSHMVSGFSVEEEAAVVAVIPVPPSGLRVIPSS